jgi:DNA recombination-dependent growth factor C
MATITETISQVAQKLPTSDSQNQHREPLQLKGVLDSFDSFDVTPVIGKEFPNAKLTDWLNAPNSDELLRDLAITSKFSPPFQCL